MVDFHQWLMMAMAMMMMMMMMVIVMVALTVVMRVTMWGSGTRSVFP